MQWSRADVIGTIGLAVAIVAAFAAVVVLKDRRTRIVLVVVLCLLTVVGGVTVCQRYDGEPGPDGSTATATTMTSVAISTQAPPPPPAPQAVVIPVNQDLVSNVEDFALTLTTVELLPNDRTRWLLSARNGTSEPKRIRLNAEETYVADDQGNRYSVTADSVGSDLRHGFEAEIPPAVRLDFWLEFSARKPGGTTFTLNLINGHFASVRFAPIEVRLPSSTKEEPKAVAAAGVKTYQINREVGSDVEHFTMTLTTVDELPNGRTRWNLVAFNRTDRNHTLRFNFEDTYCVDDEGTRYAVKGDSFNSGLNDGLQREIQPGVKLRFWIEFEPRQPPGKTFTLHLVNGHFATVRLAPVQAGLF